MARLSSRLTEIESAYDVVVIGSGYGGGITASRLARAGLSVAILERGKEFLPGEFPDTLQEATSQFQVNSSIDQSGSRTGLFELHVNSSMNVLVGCGLGGTSLINANVVIEADPRVFKDKKWPKAFRDDVDYGFKKGMARAKEMLNPKPVPDDWPSLKKLDAHQKLAGAMRKPFKRPRIAVTFEEKPHDKNHVGVTQTPCINCGDCCSGCNHTSKNTIQMNYLPDAKNFGAQIFTETSVRYVQFQDGKWNVHYENLGADSGKFGSPDEFVRAQCVILAAGTLGSTGILLRSREKGLPVSGKLGVGLSGNGDVLGFAYNTDQKINGIGWGNRAPDRDNPVGPTITGLIDTRNVSGDWKKGMCIEEGAIPGALSFGLPALFFGAAKVHGVDTDRGLKDAAQEKLRIFHSLVGGAYRGATQNTQTYLVMTHDSASGVMTLEDDRVRIKWPGAEREEIYQEVRQALIQATKALGGEFVPNPIQRPPFNDLVTVHPLGGCNMAEDATKGVVNHKGQVFSGESGTDTHEGLYVADGAVVPTAVGTNPLLTISGIAERNSALIAQDLGKTIDYSFPALQPAPPEADAVGIQFTETMTGWFSKSIKDDYHKAVEQAKIDESPFRFVLTIRSDNLDEMIASSLHEAQMSGTVEAPALSSEPLSVSDGVFNLFVDDPEDAKTKNMKYRMVLTSQSGNQFYFEGFKVIRSDPGLDLWPDTTTLYITVREGGQSTGPVVGKGILIIRPDDFAKQMTTMKVLNANGPVERLKHQVKFGKLFAGALVETYGGILSPPKYFNPDLAPRKVRPLRVSTQEIHWVRTADGVHIRLARYQGGSKGPVILVHGLGVSSKIFSTDTIDTNLLEFLFERGYDVWLLDFRASVDLPAANNQFSADEIAKYDFPAAVDRVLEVSGANDVQFLVHCFGAAAWTIAMLGGFLNPAKVRSAVVSQVSIDMRVPRATKIKTGLHVPAFLKAIGIESLTSDVDEDSGWMDKLFDRAISLLPAADKEDQTDNAVSNRISFLYGQLYELDQLNRATFDNLHEMFGVANITSFQHLALMCRKRHVVTRDGSDIYTQHLDRMAVPTLFVSGTENACYLPKSTKITMERLGKANGASLYGRKVIANYGHIDCIFGKNASNDVFPYIVQHLDRTACV